MLDSRILQTESKKNEVIRDIIRYVTGNWPSYDELTKEKKVYF